MAVNFPDSPTLNQIFASSSKVYRWDGTKWIYVSKDDSWNADGGFARSTYGGLDFIVDGGNSSGY